MWPTLIGLHDSVEYSLMEAGHTKFNPDWHFGLWKVMETYICRNTSGNGRQCN